MPYHFKAAETVSNAIKRIIAEEVDSAMERLGAHNGKERDEAVHEARKSLKKIRGVLRLIQPEIGRGFYRRENGRIRDVARRLSEIRDAGAIIEVFEDLSARFKSELHASVVAAARRGLHKAKAETEESANVDEVIGETIAALAHARKRLADVQLGADGWDAIGPGFRKYYRLGRAAMDQAGQEETPEAYHEWRKRAKDHWYHVRLLEKLWNENVEAHESSLKTLETALGDDHNLFVLKQRFTDDPDRYGARDAVRQWTDLADRRSGELRKEAMDVGGRIYGPKPARVEKQFAELWEVWKADKSEKSPAAIPRKTSNSAKIVQPRATRRAS